VHNHEKVHRFFKEPLIANSLDSWKREEVHRIVALTSDARVAELIEEAVDVTKNEGSDIMIRQLSAVSREYCNWVSW
jgi:hypothetical protein